MPEKKQEPNVYMDNTASLMQGLDNMVEMNPEEVKAYRKRIDSGRISIPRHKKKTKDE